MWEPGPTRRHTRPLLGLRRRPGRLALTVFRLPLVLYRRGWGWLLGRTFNGTKISMADYGLESLVYELNVAGARNARAAADS